MKVLDERPYRIAPAGRAADLDARLRLLVGDSTPRSRSTRCTRCSRMRSAASSAARSRTTTSTAWSSPRACRRPKIVDPARLCASTCARSASRCRRRSSRQRWPRMPDIAARAGRAVQARFDPRSAHGTSDAQRREQVRAIEQALEQVENLSEDRVLRQYLALILATTRTNFWRRDATGAPKRLPVVQVRSVARCPACPSRSRCSRSSSTRRASKACTCAAARSRAAACAGRIGPRISAPKCWASSRRRWSRTR